MIPGIDFWSWTSSATVVSAAGSVNEQLGPRSPGVFLAVLVPGVSLGPRIAGEALGPNSAGESIGPE